MVERKFVIIIAVLIICATVNIVRGRGTPKTMELKMKAERAFNPFLDPIESREGCSAENSHCLYKDCCAGLECRICNPLYPNRKCMACKPPRPSK